MKRQFFLLSVALLLLTNCKRNKLTITEKQEFNDLLQQIKNKTFVGTKIEIDGAGLEEDEKSDAALDDEKTILLSKALKRNPNITILNLMNNNIEDEGAIALSQVDTLKELDLYGNNIGVEGAIKLGQSNLETLSLSGNPITYHVTRDATPAQIITMINSFASNKTIVNLKLISCSFSQGHDEAIAHLIGNNTSIKDLNLTFNRLSDSALKYIENNTTLTSIDLYGNNITDVGCEYIAKNHCLRSLRLNKTKVGDRGAEILSTHPTLKILNLVDTEISLKGAACFIGSNLDEVHVRGHNMTEQERYVFYHKFAEAKRLIDNASDETKGRIETTGYDTEPC